MFTPGVKSISALLTIGVIVTCRLAYDRKRDIKDAAESLALVQQRRKEYAEKLTQKATSLASEISKIQISSKPD